MAIGESFSVLKAWRVTWQRCMEELATWKCGIRRKVGSGDRRSQPFNMGNSMNKVWRSDILEKILLSASWIEPKG